MSDEAAKEIFLPSNRTPPMTKGESRPVLSQIREAYSKARELAEGPERDAYLDRIGSTDPRLLKEVASLLAASVEDDGFLETSFVSKALPKLDDLVGTIVDGRYRILEKLGEGGFGVVFRVEQSKPLRRELALKVIKPGMDSREIIARFESERQALALLDHANIAHVHDAGATETGRPYFVMELAAGPPITAYCDAKRLSIEERLRLFCQVCAAVQHAHQKGIIHRDLKPSNVVVVEEPTLGDPVPKVIDFGIAKSLERRLTDRSFVTQQAELLGTPAYMSPEQMDSGSNDLDTRVDVYALGALLYELITGAQPFDWEILRRSGLNEAQRIIREVGPPKPSSRIQTLGAKSVRTADQRATQSSTLAKSLRGDLDWILMKAMEKDRDRRYQGVGDLAEDISRHLERRPVEAGPPSRVYRFRKYARRHWIGMAAVAGIILALTVGLIAALAGYRQATQQQREADAARGRSQEMVGFILEDLQPELHAFGRRKAVIAAAESAIRYFEQLPVPLRDLNTRRAHAKALQILSESYGFLRRHTNLKPQKSSGAALQASELWQEVSLEDPFDGNAAAAAVWCEFLSVYLNRWEMTASELSQIHGDLLKRFRILEKRFPENESVERGLIRLLREKGWSSSYNEPPDPKGSEVLEACQRIERMLVAHPHDDQWRYEQVMALTGLGGTFFITGQSDKAKRCFEDAMVVAEDLLCEEPYNYKYLDVAAVVADRLQWIEKSNQQRLLRIGEAREYIRILRKLDSHDIEWPVRDAVLLSAEAQILVENRQWLEAKSAVDSAIVTLSELPLGSYNAKSLGNCLALAGFVNAKSGNRSAAIICIEQIRSDFEWWILESENAFTRTNRIYIRLFWEIEVEEALGNWGSVERIAREMEVEIDKHRVELGHYYPVLRVVAHAYLGKALLNRGQIVESIPLLEEAVTRFRESVSMAPFWNFLEFRQWEAAESLAIALFKIGHQQRSAELFDWVFHKWDENVVDGGFVESRVAAARCAVQLVQVLSSNEQIDMTRQQELLNRAHNLLGNPATTLRLTAEEEELHAQIAERLGR